MAMKLPDLEPLLDKLGFNALLLLKVLIILLGAFVLERILYSLIRRAYQRSDKSHEDTTRYRFMKNALRSIVVLVALGWVIYVIPSLKHFAVTLLAGAGILVAILGLATQRAFSNIISGVFIVSSKPFRVGDMVEISREHRGVVEDITLRHTVIRNWENRRVIIPNAVISDATIINSTIEDPATCQWVEIGISYESDLDKAMGIMQEEAENHPHCMDRRTAEELEQGIPKVSVRLVQIAESSLVLRAYVWAADPVQARVMNFELNRSIKLRFDREGIVIPYPQRTISFKGEGPSKEDLQVLFKQRPGPSHEEGA
ncbi:MAG: mechanosensitive ion channel family protein [Flavobacteriales bacterium]|nr:mechanosensitive ion channel family protein [Flavobacteriales bacterium]